MVGDGVLAVFGIAGSPATAASSALAATLAMLDDVRSWSQNRVEAGLPGIEIGVGLHHGRVFAGVVGQGELLEFTVIGSAANEAARVESQCKVVGKSGYMQGGPDTWIKHAQSIVDKVRSEKAA